MSEQEPTKDQVRTDDPTPPGTSGTPEGTVSTRNANQKPATRQRTRIGAAWLAVAVAVIVLVVLLVFILQNQQAATVVFFGAQGQLPLGVLVLLAAAGGALLVIVLGVARMIQLQWQARRDRRAAVRS
jgi:uncharacterized integral membrane protein